MRSPIAALVPALVLLAAAGGAGARRRPAPGGARRAAWPIRPARPRSTCRSSSSPSGPTAGAGALTQRRRRSDVPSGARRGGRSYPHEAVSAADTPPRRRRRRRAAARRLPGRDAAALERTAARRGVAAPGLELRQRPRVRRAAAPLRRPSSPSSRTADAWSRSGRRLAADGRTACTGWRATAGGACSRARSRRSCRTRPIRPASTRAPPTPSSASVDGGATFRRAGRQADVIRDGRRRGAARPPAGPRAPTRRCSARTTPARPGAASRCRPRCRRWRSPSQAAPQRVLVAIADNDRGGAVADRVGRPRRDVARAAADGADVVRRRSPSARPTRARALRTNRHQRLAGDHRHERRRRRLRGAPTARCSTAAGRS